MSNNPIPRCIAYANDAIPSDGHIAPTIWFIIALTMCVLWYIRIIEINNKRVQTRLSEGDNRSIAVATFILVIGLIVAVPGAYVIKAALQ